MFLSSEIIVVVGIFVLPTLWLSGLFFGVRQILRSTYTTGRKAALLTIVVGTFVIVSLMSLGLLLASAGGYNH